LIQQGTHSAWTLGSAKMCMIVISKTFEDIWNQLEKAMAPNDFI
jgi:hypothetical protein